MAGLRLISCDSSFQRRIEELPPEKRQVAIFLRMFDSPAYFARHALPHHCRLPFAPFHELLFEWQKEMNGPPSGRRGRRFVLAAPRGCAKSTIASLVLPLHDIVFHRERYIVLLSATEAQARGRLRAIRAELQNSLSATMIAPRKMRFSAATLECDDIRMDAFGAGTEVRGISHEGYRPTKIILDDADASSVATSQRARERLLDWFSSVVEHLGDVYTHIIAVGTVLHRKSLLSHLLERPDFTGYVQRAIEKFAPEDALWREWRERLLDYQNPDRRLSARRFFLEHHARMSHEAVVAWPEKEDYEDLLAQLTLQGRHAFYREKQNAPLASSDCLFDSSIAVHARIAQGCVSLGTDPEAPARVYTLPALPRRFGYLDAALGKGGRAGKGDFAALAVVLMLDDSTMVLERVLARRLSPTAQAALLFDLHAESPFSLLGVEGTGFQELMTLAIQQEEQRRADAGRPLRLPVQIIHPRKNKGLRIAALEPLISSGRLAVGGLLDEEFREELDTYPQSRHDDALDAVAGAVELALRGEARLAEGISQAGRGRVRQPGRGF